MTWDMRYFMSNSNNIALTLDMTFRHLHDIVQSNRHATIHYKKVIRHDIIPDINSYMTSDVISGMTSDMTSDMATDMAPGMTSDILYKL